MTLRHLVLVLGDQLDSGSTAFDGFDPAHDGILQMEVREEPTYIRQHKRRLAFFFAAMRHFRDEQRAARPTEATKREPSGSGELARRSMIIAMPSEAAS